MSFRRLLSQTVTIVRASTVNDPYGTPVKDWTTVTRTAYPARLEQTLAQEITTDRDTVTSDWRLFLEASAVIGPYDRVEADGKTLEVVGSPSVEHTPRGPHHIEARLVLANG